MRKYRNDAKEPEELTFWQSYSDMMAALLLVFVLIIAFAISLTKSTYEEKQAELEAQNEEISRFKEELQQQAQKLEEQQAKIDEQKVAFEQQQERLDAIVGIRTTIIKNLKDEFEDTDMNIVVDSETGAISFDSSILFDVDSSVLKREGRDFLNEFFPMYFETLLSDSIKDYVSEVIIEGHTDDVGTYLYNLDLSQRRASAVVKYCLAENGSMFDKDHLEMIRSLVTANGRSFVDVIRKENGEVDRQASRRVEIKFRLREDEMIQEMKSILSK
jgi:chemotaxis protein MotB